MAKEYSHGLMEEFIEEGTRMIKKVDLGPLHGNNKNLQITV
jgi:hypothetical protein